MLEVHIACMAETPTDRDVGQDNKLRETEWEALRDCSDY
jgi:hypothetical protein